MNKKNSFYLFISSLLSYGTIFAHNEQKISYIYTFLNNLSHAAWASFFFVTRIIGAILMGNVSYCIQALLLLALVIAIEAYTLHRLTKVIYSRVLQRMIIINVIHTIIALLVILLNVFKILITYKYLGIFVLLGIRMLVSYFVYTKMDHQVNKKLLKKAMVIANSLSFAFTTIVIMLIKI